MKKKLLIIIGSLFLSLVLIEGALHLGKHIFIFLQNKNIADQIKNDDIRILCIGESTTALGFQDSYPSQLQKLLNDNSSQKKFTIINKGLPGQTTTQIKEALPHWIAQYQPHFIISMLGINDFSTPKILIEGKKGFEIKIFKLFRHLHQYNFDNLFQTKSESTFKSFNIKDNNPNKEIYNSIAKSFVNQQYLKVIKLSKDVPLLKNVHYKYTLSKSYLNSLDLENARKLNEEILLNDEVTWKIILDYEDLANSTGAKNSDEAIYFYKLWLSNSKDIYKTSTMMARFAYNTSYAQQNKEKKNEYLKLARQALDKLPKESYDNKVKELLKRIDAGHDGKLIAMDEMEDRDKYTYQTIKNQSEKNQSEMIEIILDQNVYPIIMQYPLRSIDPLVKLHGNKKALFIENKQNFEKALKENTREKVFVDQFAGDFGHCTPFGNQLIAKNIYAQMLNILKDLYQVELSPLSP